MVYCPHSNASLCRERPKVARVPHTVPRMKTVSRGAIKNNSKYIWPSAQILEAGQMGKGKVMLHHFFPASLSLILFNYSGQYLSFNEYEFIQWGKSYH